MADHSPSTCWVSFGGNIGDVRATFDAALALLSLHNQIVLGRRSGLYGSSPMGSHAGSRFLNSICELKTQLSACELLTVLQSVETQLGRVRTICWGPRTLDLDLLSYGSSVFDEPQLIVPHPALTYRRFVLVPLVEIDSDWCHPACSKTAAQLLQRLEVRPLKITLLDFPVELHNGLSTQLRSKFPHVQLVPPEEVSDDVTRMVMSSPPAPGDHTVIDLRRSPGEAFEKLTSALTAIFDSPVRLSDW